MASTTVPAQPLNEVEIRRCTVTIPTAAKLSKAPFQTELILKQFSLSYSEDDGKVPQASIVILLVDLVGITVFHGPPESSPSGQTCRVLVNEYSLDCARGPGGKRIRSLKVSPFDFDQEANFDANHGVAQEWKKAVLLESYRASRKTFDTTEDLELENVTSVSRRRLLVFINPVAGQGRGESLFTQHVQPLFEMAEIEFTVTVTTRLNHARELVKELDLSTIDGIVISSGDGLVYEVVNGLMERADWQTAIKTPIGILPTGSGNVLATNIMHEADEEYGVSCAAFIIVRGGLTQADLATVEMKDGTKIFMSLISCWGYTADLDIESERFRSLGESRFVLGGLKSIIQHRLYPGRLSYLPFEEESPEEKPLSNGKEQGETREEVASESQEVKVSQNNSRQEQLTCPPTDLLVPLSDPVPSNWKTVEGQFVGVNIVMTPFLGHNAIGTTDQCLGSGKIHIVYSLELSRFGMLHMLLTVGSGSYLNRADTLTVKTRAYRLEPLTSEGILVVDGEVVEYGPIQVQVHPHMLRIMSRKRREQVDHIDRELVAQI